MKHVLATIIAFFSAFLIYMALGLIFGDFRGKGGVPAIAWLGFLGGWIGTHYIVVKGTNRLSKVLSRGCLIGAIEWLAMIVVGVIFSAKTVVGSAGDLSGLDQQAGAAIGSGLFAVLTGGISVFMTVVCLIGFTIAYFIGKSFKTDRETKECLVCAEVINFKAKKCKYCGAQLDGQAVGERPIGFEPPTGANELSAPQKSTPPNAAKAGSE